MQSTIKEKNEKEEVGITEIKKRSPIYSFMYASKSSEARRQYPRKLKLLFHFIGLSGSLENQATEFLERTGQDIQSCQYTIIGFIDFHKCYFLRLEVASRLAFIYYTDILPWFFTVTNILIFAGVADFAFLIITSDQKTLISID